MDAEDAGLQGAVPDATAHRPGAGVRTEAKAGHQGREDNSGEIRSAKPDSGITAIDLVRIALYLTRGGSTGGVHLYWKKQNLLGVYFDARV